MSPAVVTLTGIEITQAPARTAYEVGEDFDPTGMIVTAHYSNGTSKVVEGWTVTDGSNLTQDSTSVTISYTEDNVTETAVQVIVVTLPQPPAEKFPIKAVFVKKGLFGSFITTVSVTSGGSCEAPDANRLFQTDRNWISENGTLFVESNGTVTYDQLLEALGGAAYEGATVRFVTTREKPAPQPQPDTQRVVLSFQNNGVEVGTAELDIAADSSFVTAAQAQKYLPAGYDFAEPSMNYTIDSGSAVIPVVPAENPGPIEPTENPITVTFQVNGWGSRLDCSSGKTMTVTLYPGQSMTAPYARRSFGRIRSVEWTCSNLDLQIASGEELTYEMLAARMGQVPEDAAVTFTGSAGLR